jgi:hypothetical protein
LKRPSTTNPRLSRRRKYVASINIYLLRVRPGRDHRVEDTVLPSGENHSSHLTPCRTGSYKSFLTLQHDRCTTVTRHNNSAKFQFRKAKSSSSSKDSRIRARHHPRVRYLTNTRDILKDIITKGTLSRATLSRTTLTRATLTRATLNRATRTKDKLILKDISKDITRDKANLFRDSEAESAQILI